MSKMPDGYLEARTTEIRDAAMRVFVRKGINATTMQDIASEAGLSAGALYRYFEGKEQLVRAVFEYCREENRALFEEAPSDIGSPLNSLFAVGRVVWDEFRQAGVGDRYAVQLAVTLGGGGRDDRLTAETRGTHADVLERLAALVRQAQVAGELANDIDADALALTILSCVQGLQMFFVEFDEEMNTEGVYNVLGRMLRGLAPAQKEG